MTKDSSLYCAAEPTEIKMNISGAYFITARGHKSEIFYDKMTLIFRI
jgi:hypothetical protein